MTERRSGARKSAPRKRKKLWLRIVLLFLCIYILYDLFFAITLPPRVAAYLRKYPDAAHRHIGWCGTPSLEMSMAFGRLIFGAPAECVIPLLDNRAPNLRGAVKQQLRTTLVLSYPAICWCYFTGNARIKLELIDLVKIKPSREQKQALLAKIVNDPGLPVFYEDKDVLPTHQEFYGGMSLPGDTAGSVDEVKFYLRLMTESDYAPDKADAASHLAMLGAEAKDTIPYITDLFKLPDEYIPGWGFQAIGGFDTTLHGSAMLALGEMGADTPEIIQQINTYYTGSDPELSLIAALTLYKLDNERESILEDLLNRLKTETNTEILAVIARVLGNIGPDASDAIPDLIELGANGDRNVQWSARDAISRIEGSLNTSLAILAEHLRSSNEGIRYDAIMELHRMPGEGIKSVAPAILDVLDDVHGEERYFLCETLFNTGEYKKETALALAEMIDWDQEGETRAVSLLTRMGRDAIDALPTLKRMVESDNPVRVSAGVPAYLAVGGDPDYAVEVLIDRLNSTNPNMVNAAISALKDIGPDASDALPALRALRGVSDRQTRSLINEAIEGIE